MKKLILTISILAYFVLHGVAQTKEVYVEGYYIISYPKDEIVFAKKNEIMRQHGLSNSLPIDFTKRVFYFAKYVNERELVRDKDIAVSTAHEMANLEYFKFPPLDGREKIYREIFRESGIASDSLLDTSPVWGAGEATYYVLAADTTRLYRIYQINGKAFRITVPSDFLDSDQRIALYFEYELDSYEYLYTSRSLPSLYVYLFYDIESINSKSPPAGFEKWITPTYTHEELFEYNEELIQEIDKRRRQDRRDERRDKREERRINRRR